MAQESESYRIGDRVQNIRAKKNKYNDASTLDGTATVVAVVYELEKPYDMPSTQYSNYNVKTKYILSTPLEMKPMELNSSLKIVGLERVPEMRPDMRGGKYKRNTKRNMRKSRKSRK